MEGKDHAATFNEGSLQEQQLGQEGQGSFKSNNLLVTHTLTSSAKLFITNNSLMVTHSLTYPVKLFISISILLVTHSLPY